MLRRTAALTAAGLFLGLATLSAGAATAAPVQREAVDTLPAEWSTGGAGDVSFVRGPEGVSSGAGSMKIQYLVNTTSTPTSAYSFDTKFFLAKGITARLFLHQTTDDGRDIALFAVMADPPPSGEWEHFTIQPDTVFHIVDYSAENWDGGEETWSQVTQGGGSITRAEFSLDDGYSGLSGNPIEAYVDTLTTSFDDYDFEPVQQPVSSVSAPTVTYGQSVTIGGKVLDASDAPMARVPAYLSFKADGTSSFTAVDDYATSANGRVYSEEAPTISGTYQWASYTGRTSTTHVDVAPALVATPARTSVPKGKKLAVSGTAAPLPPGTKVVLRRSGSSASLGTTTVLDDGSYKFSVTAPRGSYKIWTTTKAVAGYVAGTSDRTSVKVG